MTLFDLAAFLVLLTSGLFGLWRGFLSEMIALVTWGLAFLAAQQWSPLFVGFFLGGIKDAGLQPLIAWIAVFVLVLLLMGVARTLLTGLIRAMGMGRADRIIGALFGLLRGMFLCILTVAALGMTSLPRSPVWQEARLAPPLETAVLILRPWLPPEMARRIRFK